MSFIVISIITKNEKSNYIEYTSLSKHLANLYILAIYLMILIHLINPKYLCSFISENFSFLTSSLGKQIINLSISILYWSSDNKGHLVFVVISFVSSLILFLNELIFQCKILNNINFNKKNINKRVYKGTNHFNNNITINN